MPANPGSGRERIPVFTAIRRPGSADSRISGSTVLR